jgi:hypothetical protein
MSQSSQVLAHFGPNRGSRCGNRAAASLSVALAALLLVLYGAAAAAAGWRATLRRDIA